MNEYDSNRIADLLQSIDLKRVDDEQLADYFIFNTCHIREKATQKVYSDIGKIKKIFRDKRSKPTFILQVVWLKPSPQLFLKKVILLILLLGLKLIISYQALFKSMIKIEKKYVILI